MGSFNANIPFQAFADNSSDPIQNYIKLAQFKQQQRAADLENQVNQMKLADMVRQQKQQGAIDSAVNANYAAPNSSQSYQEPTMNLGGMAIPGKNVQVSTPGGLNQNGVLQSLAQQGQGGAALGMQNQFAQQDAAKQQESAKLQEALSKAHTEQLNQISKELELSGQAFGALKQLPPDQQQQLYPQVRQKLIEQGVIHPSQAPEQLSPGWLDQQITQGMTVAQQVAAEKDKRQAAEAQQKQADTLGSKTIETDKGVMQYNPATKTYDKRVGGLPPKASSAAGPGASPDDPKSIAAGIMRGDLPPTVKGLYRNASPVLAELSRQGYNLQRAETDWNAVQKHIQTLNGAQQTRLNQAISTASDSLDKINSLYDEYQKLAPTAGIKVINKASLAIAKQLPGRPGAVAQALEAQIADLTSELGNVYMGGNSPTDHALSLAKQNLSSDWNRETFKEAIKQAKLNLGIRRNSIMNSGVVGARSDSPYLPGAQAAPQAAPAANDPFTQFGGKAH